MKKYRILFMSFLCLALFSGLSIMVFAQECGPVDCYGKKVITNPPCYQLLFFRHDGRVLITLPRRTNLVEIRSSTVGQQGWVRAYNCWRQPLAIDNLFNGTAVVSTSVQKACFPNRIVVTMHNKDSVGIFTPSNARYVEIINASSGFDGTVNVLDSNKRILARQTGLDIQVTDFTK